MSTFAVMAFGDEKKAYEGLHALQVLHAEGAVTVWGSAVLQRETDQLDDTRRSLEYMGERYEWELVGAKQELDANIEALLAQASGAKPEGRARIEQRMAEVRAEFAERQRKLERARELTRQALRP